MANPIAIKGFAPDLDPATPGILIDCENVWPSTRGIIACNSPTNAGLPALSSVSLGSALIERLDGTRRSFVGTATKQWEDVGGTWTDRTRPNGAYTSGSQSVWRYSALGQVTMAVNGADKLQQTLEGTFTDMPVGIGAITVTAPGSGYTSVPTVTIGAPDQAGGIQATAIAVLSGTTVAGVTIQTIGVGYTVNPTVTITGGAGTGAVATAQIVQVPVGKIVTVCAGQVFVCNMTAPSYVATADAWFCSGLYDQTAWTPSQATQCAYARIIDTPGGITAAQPLGQNLVIYKNGSMFLGTFQGPPVIWAFESISVKVGTYCQESVIPIGTAHYFIGPDNFYFYQVGGQPVPIGDNVKEWFFKDINPLYTTNMSSYYDEQKSLLFWAYVSNNSQAGTIDRCLVYNWKTGMWGRQDLDMQCFVQSLNGEITFDNLGSQGWTNWDNLPAIAYDSTYWTNARVSMAYMDTTNTMQNIVGVPLTSSITIGDMGDDLMYSRFTTCKLRFSDSSTLGDVTAQWNGRDNLGDPNTKAYGASTGDMHNNTLDVDQSARWHRLVVSLNGGYELTGWLPELIQEGGY